SLLMWITQV
nr:Chain C, SYNTHETIC PEPTIDE [Homo sapiens]3GJF_C Chain C, NYESO-1 peptide [synthetic construct]3GJF_F Chain F, NYESO-1 peptide [synthetic construct]3HAE_C Chain C, NYESO-1 peptide [synthetic construct]3HAE_F Chain F, NYESO-1 peptide [synthetic construct]3HAE_M Chain M, NYESO-1 peptide [synthetic construct]3HAE_R Chain R, NYESO-1 peptide [synthetic construct]6Q3S_C Chain C, SER-LEU-LEU-MET-TRP-ILE-THR-GLN-VAL [Homo sapiens]6RP9_C Chain C, Cancer/testis antigen 1 [Homo sapiens]6RP9_H Chain